MVNLVQAVGADTGAATAASLTVTFAAAGAGNLLVGAANSDATISTPSGWTLFDSAVSNQGTYLFYKVAAGGETSVTFTPSVTDTVAGAVLEYSGLTATPADVSAHANRSSSSAVTASTGTTAATAQAVELVIAVAGPHSYSHTLAPTSPTWVTATNRISQATLFVASAPQNSALFVGDYVTSSSGTQTETCTWTNSSQDAGGIIAAFKASGGVTGSVTDTSTATITVGGVNAAVGAASLTETATITAAGVNSAVGAGTVSATATITAGASVTSPSIGGGVTGWDLYSTLAQQAAYIDYYRTTPPVACPHDGEPLLQGPSTTPGVLYCPWGNFRYPQDWDPETMAGL